MACGSVFRLWGGVYGYVLVIRPAGAEKKVEEKFDPDLPPADTPLVKQFRASLVVLDHYDHSIRLSFALF